MSRVLVVSSDIVGERMAGPGIRAWELSRVLSTGHQVTLAAPPPLPSGPLPFAAIPATRRELDAAAGQHEVAVVQGSAFELSQALQDRVPALVVDLYDPYPIEALELYRDLSQAERGDELQRDLGRLREQCLAGDFFICASERQRLFWLGVLASLGRVEIGSYDEDSSLRRLLDVVPFGVPDEPPGPPAGLRGQVAGIERGDFVVVWGGGIWNWLDPLTLVDAVALLAPDLPGLKAVFMGSGHPNPAVPRMRVAAAARQRAQELGLLDKHVFFRGDWVPYADRGPMLADCDVGVSLHQPGVEADLAFRTRVLDYLWAGLPVILTEGDATAELVAGAGGGLTVPPSKPDELAAALHRLADDGELRDRCREGSRALAARLTWTQVAEPLARFCRSPRRTRPDGAWARPAGSGSVSIWRRAWRVFRRDGPAAVLERAQGYVRRRI